MAKQPYVFSVFLNKVSNISMYIDILVPLKHLLPILTPPSFFFFFKQMLENFGSAEGKQVFTVERLQSVISR